MTSILVVDDEELLTRGLQKKLQAQGFEAAGVLTACDAIRFALTTPPDVVLLDIYLKGAINGIHLGAQFRALNVPIIYMTGYLDATICDRARENYPIAMISKPFQVHSIGGFIESALRFGGGSKVLPKAEVAPLAKVS